MAKYATINYKIQFLVFVILPVHLLNNIHK